MTHYDCVHAQADLLLAARIDLIMAKIPSTSMPLAPLGKDFGTLIITKVELTS